MSTIIQEVLFTSHRPSTFFISEIHLSIVRSNHFTIKRVLEKLLKNILRLQREKYPVLISTV